MLTMPQERELGPDPATFFAFDFYLHDTQATPLARGSRPAYGAAVQYIVTPGPALLEYLASGTLRLELCSAQGLDFAVLGAASVPLSTLLRDLELGAGGWVGMSGDSLVL